MFFDHKNTMRNCSVYCVGDESPIENVLSVDTSTKEVTFCDKPIKVDGNKVLTHELKFTAIAPVYAGSPFPCMFLCFP